jgi:hypothetical protein
MTARDDDNWVPLGDAADRVVAKSRPTFRLTIEYAGNLEFEIHGLRKLLKDLIRRHRFRCLELREEQNQVATSGNLKSRGPR